MLKHNSMSGLPIKHHFMKVQCRVLRLDADESSGPRVLFWCGYRWTPLGPWLLHCFLLGAACPGARVQLPTG